MAVPLSGSTRSVDFRTSLPSSQTSRFVRSTHGGEKCCFTLPSQAGSLRHGRKYATMRLTPWKRKGRSPISGLSCQVHIFNRPDHWTRGSVSQEPAEPARQCVPRPRSQGTRAPTPNGVVPYSPGCVCYSGIGETDTLASLPQRGLGMRRAHQDASPRTMDSVNYFAAVHRVK